MPSSPASTGPVRPMAPTSGPRVLEDQLASPATTFEKAQRPLASASGFFLSPFSVPEVSCGTDTRGSGEMLAELFQVKEDQGSTIEWSLARCKDGSGSMTALF